MLLSVWRWRGEEDVMIPAAGVGANAAAEWMQTTESTAVRTASDTLMLFPNV